LSPNAFDKELGTGVTIYFKLLRYLAFMFLFFTALSLPTYFVCGLNGNTNLSTKKTGLGNFLSTFSLGNVGKASEVCSTINIPSTEDLSEKTLNAHFNKNKDFIVTCPYGDPKFFTEVGLINTTCKSRGKEPISGTKYENLINKGKVEDNCNLALFNNKGKTDSKQKARV
jgi:hypothetical protein